MTSPQESHIQNSPHPEKDQSPHDAPTIQRGRGFKTSPRPQTLLSYTPPTPQKAPQIPIHQHPRKSQRTNRFPKWVLPHAHLRKIRKLAASFPKIHANDGLNGSKKRQHADEDEQESESEQLAKRIRLAEEKNTQFEEGEIVEGGEGDGSGLGLEEVDWDRLFDAVLLAIGKNGAGGGAV